MKSNPKYSVLMTIYHGADELNFLECFDSILAQTCPPDDIVVYCDGPLTNNLDQALNHLIAKYKCLNVIRNNVNRGQGLALADGIFYCKHNIIMRMDADDICLENRAEIELPYMEKFDLISSWIDEFENDKNNIVSVRTVPENTSDIIKYSKKRCPFNQVAVMFKKDAVLRAGNYKDLMYAEDYDLWIRMIQSGAKIYNIQKSLVLVRAGSGYMSRRAGLTYKQSLKKLRKYMYDSKYLTKIEYWKACFLHTAYLMVPLSLKSTVHKLFLRKNK